MNDSRRTIVIPYWESPYSPGDRCVRMASEICEELTRLLQAQGVIVQWLCEEHKGLFERRERWECAFKALHELTGLPYDFACDVLPALEAAVARLRLTPEFIAMVEQALIQRAPA